MKNETGLSPVKRYVMPILAIISCLFMVIAAYLAHGRAVIFYLIIFAIVMLIGVFFRKNIITDTAETVQQDSL